MIDPECIACAAIVKVVTSVILQVVVSQIVDATKAYRWAKFVALTRVVVHHVKNHFDISVMQ